MVATSFPYNKYTGIENFSANCIGYLMRNDEIIWKLLKYVGNDALDQPNLTIEEKSALIYNGNGDETLFRVFLDSGQDNVWNPEAFILRVPVYDVYPDNFMVGRIVMGFEMYSHYKINTLNNYTTRLENAMASIFKVFNGADIGGLGRLYFDKKAGQYCKSRPIGRPPLLGRYVTMCNFLSA